MSVQHSVNQLQDYYLQQAYETGLEMADLIGQNAGETGNLDRGDREFYRALMQLAVVKQRSNDRAGGMWSERCSQISSLVPHLSRLATQGQPIAIAKVALLEAEVARINRNWLQAIEQYEQALTLLEHQHLPLETAIACERAALFYLDWGKPRLATPYWQEAIVHYKRASQPQKAAQIKRQYENELERFLALPEALARAERVEASSTETLSERALQDSEQRYAFLAQASPVGIFRNDIEGNCLYGNKRGFEMIGIPEAEALGQGWSKTLHPDDRDRVISAWTDFVQQGVPFACEYRFLRPDGTLCWVFGQAYAETDSHGQITSYIGTITDISEQKQIAAALQDSEAKYRRLAESIPGVIYRYLLRTDGSDAFTYISPRIQDFCAVTAEAIEQKATRLWSQIFPEDVPQLQRSIAQSRQTLEPWSCEFRLCSPHHGVTWMQGRSIPTQQANGDVIWDGILIDITDRKQTEEALRQKEAYLRTVINHSPVILWAIDEQGIFTLSDGQGLKALGLQPGEAVGLSMFDLYGDIPEVITAFQHTFETGEPYHILTTVNGCLWEGQGTPLLDPQGRVIGIIGVSIDITERHRAQQLLTDYNRTLEQQVQERTLALAQEVKERQIAEQALREKELFLRSIYDGVAEAIFVVDVLENGVFRYAGLNPAHERSTGLISAQVQGKTPQEIVPPDLASQVTQHYQDCLAAGDTISYEESIVMDGQESWWLTSLTPLRNETGEIYRLIGSATNISDRKRVEAALQQSEATQRQILTALPDLVIWMNRQGQQIKQLNGGGTKSLVSQVEGMGANIEQILPPQLAQQRMAAVDQALLTGKLQRYEQQLWVKGTLQDEEVRVIPVGHETALVIVRDMSEQQAALRKLKKAQAELQAQQAFLSQVLDVIPSAIAVKDEQGRFLILNQAAAALYGYPIEQILGRREAELSALGRPIPQWEQFQPEVMETLQTKLIPDQRIERSPGDVRWYQTILAPFIDQQGQVRGMISSSTEITNLKQAEQELWQAKEHAEAANRAKSIFLANMSHELRTPLNAILGFSHLLGRSTNLSGEQQDNLRTIRRSGEHLLTLINQVLDLSKIEAGRMTLNPSLCHLPTLLKEVEAMFWLQLKQQRIDWQLWLDPQVPPSLQTDDVKLRQVLINLISNAVKFTPYGGSIQLRVGLQSAAQDQATAPMALQFEVIDSGVGIPPQDFPRLIQPFVQTSSGQSLQEGTGLGLTISYQFICLLGGQMTVVSHGKSYTIGDRNQEAGDPAPATRRDCPLRGTCFRFTIPLAGTAEALPVSLSDPEPSSPGRAIALAPHQPTYRLLVVDDSDHNCQLLIQLLQPLGFELQAAHNGEEALQIDQWFHPHLIWMDLRMPVLDGYGAIAQIKATHPDQSPVIIALTASVLTEEPPQHPCSPWDDLIYKPFQPEEIFTALQRHLGVQFIYEADQPSCGEAALMETIPAQDWTALSPTWGRALHQAVLEGDCQEMVALIESIRPQHPAIAHSLMGLVNHYKFEQILSLIESCG